MCNICIVNTVNQTYDLLIINIISIFIINDELFAVFKPQIVCKD